MDPIRLLMDEHRAIKGVLDALDGYVEHQASVPRETHQADILRFVEFIQQYADRIHHGKEEDILFERMVATGFPKQSGPLAVMYHEHDQGRGLVKELKGLGEHQGQWSAAERKRLVAAARSYTTLLRNHIHKEDNVLYPMAESGLGPDAIALVEQRFEEFENREKRSGEKARLEELSAELIAEYGKRVV